MNNLLSSKNSSRYRFVPLLTIAVCLLSFGKISPAVAGEARSYKNITQDKFNTCVKTDKTDQGYAKYKGSNSGEVELWAKGALFVPDWVAGNLSYKFDSRNNTLDYSLIQANFPATEGAIWNGINDMIRRCGGRV